MVREAEEFASEDDAQRKRIEALNSLQNYVWSLKSQLADTDGLGGKVSDEDKKAILAAVKEATEWVDINGQSATADELDEKLAEVQAIVQPITGKLYDGGSEDEPTHEEL